MLALVFVAGNLVKSLHCGIPILLSTEPLHVSVSSHGGSERLNQLLASFVNLDLLGLPVMLCRQ